VYVLVGQFCPTDANPDTDVAEDAPYVAFAFKTRQEAEEWPGRLWYPNARVLEVVAPPS
jgi:hypothetical protein